MMRAATRVGLLLGVLAGCGKADNTAPAVRVEGDPVRQKAAPKQVEAELFFTNVAVIDVAAGEARPGLTVAVKGDRITAVLPAEEVLTPAGAKVIDGTGKFLIPGLWDMHVHLAERSFPAWFLRYGVTGVRHMFAVNPYYNTTRPANPGDAPVPRVVIANQILDGPDSVFPSLFGSNVVKVADAGAARKGVREIQKKGNDFLKVYSSLPREAYFAAVDEAKALGLPVGGHVPRSVTVAEASDAGQLTVEHLEGVAFVCSKREDRHFAQLRDKQGEGKGFDAATGWRIMLEAHENFDADKGNALFEKFVKNGTWHVPTLIQTRQMARLADDDIIDPAVAKQLPEFLTRLWERKLSAEDVWVPNVAIRLTKKDLRDREALFRADMEMVRRMHKAGVGILAGTDTTAPFVVPGLALHEELALLVEAGLKPAEALRAATLNPARCLKREADLGTIEVGKLADLVLLAKNPLDDIRNTRSIEAVYVGGRPVEK